MVSVLGAYSGNTSLFPELASQQSQIAERIRTQTALRFAEKKTVIDDQLKQRQEFINAESDRWVSVKAGIFNAQAAADTGRDAINAIQTLLLAIRTPVSLAGEAGEDQELRATEFDTKLMAINGEADRMGPAFNLVGSINRVDYTPNKIEYRSDLGTGTTVLHGGYAGSDYRIEASDGTVWVPELGTNTLTNYSALQGVKKTVSISANGQTVTIDKTASYMNGITLGSYDKSTGAITLNVTVNPEDPPMVVTGTLQKSGIGLMPAWFYDGLTTADGRKRAFADINEAEAQLSLASAAVTSAKSRVAGDARRADNAISELNRQNSDAMVSQLEATQTLQIEYQKQVQAMVNNLDNLSRQQQNYVDAFASTIASNPFLDVLT